MSPSRNAGETGAATPKSAAPHTPGPWTVHFRFGRLTTVNGRQRFPICDTGTAPHGEANTRREEANARLIAAAPELSVEAREICAILDEHSAHDGEALVYDYAAVGEEIARRHESLTAAIAKATGQ